MSKGKVLIVDDDPLALQITRKRLEKLGFEVSSREQALGTVQAVREENPDIVVLDYKMPALSGDRLARLVREAPGAEEIPVVFHSSESLVMLQRAAKEVGALGAIPKTEDDEVFSAHFVRLFERARRERASS